MNISKISGCLALITFHSQMADFCQVGHMFSLVSQPSGGPDDPQVSATDGDSNYSHLNLYTAFLYLIAFHSTEWVIA